MPPIKEINFFTDRYRTAESPIPKRDTPVLPRVSKTTLSGRRNLKGTELSEADRLFLQHALTFDSYSSNMDWYARLFEPKAGKLTGDISPSYATLDKSTIAEIGHHFPDLGIIFLVREPIARAWSQLSMRVRRGDISAEDLRDWSSIRRILDAPEVAYQSHPVWTYTAWSAIFPPDRLFVGFFDDLCARPAWLKEQICNFLGIVFQGVADQRDPEFNAKANERKFAMSDDVRDNMIAYFQEERERCAHLFGGPAVAWMDLGRR
jgi:hypothetical protein